LKISVVEGRPIVNAAAKLNGERVRRDRRAGSIFKRKNFCRGRGGGALPPSLSSFLFEVWTHRTKTGGKTT